MKIPFKQWAAEEAVRRQLSTRVVLRHFYEGRYPGMRIRCVNARVLFVIACPNRPQAPRGVRLAQWAIQEAARRGVTPNAVRMRLWRGKYPGVKLERSDYRVYVL